MLSTETREKIYAGVLGKIIGVYLGRPVEGWSYEKIRSTYDFVDRFVHKGPVIEVDDDISGTFSFIRILEQGKDFKAEDAGALWLNQIIENKTIFWWGGMFRSTEHTAYERLKEGYHAPQSGSYQLNGKITATQIGAMIFIDGFGLVNPDDPQKASEMARKSASVSHDLIAIECAQFIAALEAIVFSEHDIYKACLKACDIVNSDEVKQYVFMMHDKSESASGWREVRDWIAAEHPYEKYGGNCPCVTNFLIILMSLFMSGDDFKRAIGIAASSGFDTDCNAGNVGCITAVRLGLESIEKSGLRETVNDRMYIVTAIGDQCIADASSAARKLISFAENERPERIYKKEFCFRGGTSGCYLKNGIPIIQNGAVIPSDDELSFDTFYPSDYQANGYDLVGSPSIYPGQEISAEFENDDADGLIRFYVEYLGKSDIPERIYSHKLELNLTSGNQIAKWKIPSGYGYPIIKAGIQNLSSRQQLHCKWIDWDGEPDILYEGLFKMSPDYIVGRKVPSWFNSFIDSTSNTTVDHLSTICLSNVNENGLLYIGGQDWKNYEVSMSFISTMQEKVGIVFAVNGLRRYYEFSLTESKAELAVVENDHRKVLASFSNYPIVENEEYKMHVYKKGSKIIASSGSAIFEIFDNTYKTGGAGMIISRGTALIRLFQIKPINNETD